MKMKNMMVVMLPMVILFYGNACLAQSAKDAVRALQKLQARVEAGISYRDYAPALGDALFEVKLFLASPEAKTKPALASAVSKTMEHYLIARQIWEFDTYRYSATPENKNLVKKIYPELSDKVDRDAFTFVVKEAVQMSLKRAQDELEKATALLSQN